MTRKSPREIENLLDNLEGGTVNPETVRDWVDAYVEHLTQNGWEMEYGPTANFEAVDVDGTVVEEPNHSGELCVMETGGDAGFEFYVPEAEIPDWIDRDALPVRE